MELEGIYRARVRPIGPQRELTGIYKEACAEAEIGELGIDGDTQVDKRYHGGPDKALHQYAQASYPRLIAAFPQLAASAVPGSIGENLSVPDMDESNVCIGDIYGFGAVRVQVSEPRQPCWKISARYDCEAVTEFVRQQGITGWYLRVLDGGRLRLGDPVSLRERPNPELSIAHFNRVFTDPKADADTLNQLIQGVGLAPGLRERLEQRRDGLKA